MYPDVVDTVARHFLPPNFGEAGPACPEKLVLETESLLAGPCAIAACEGCMIRARPTTFMR
jgi:hypothetical protein